MTEMYMWALRSKTTGLFIGAGGNSSGRGGSWSEADSRTPRLWPTRNGPQGFLNQWLKGTASRTSFTDFESGHREEGGLHHKHQPHRRREDMEVVKFILTEHK